MWLDIFIFCESSLGATLTYEKLVNELAQGHRVALGKMILGALYKMMDLITGCLISDTLGGPLWILQLWLYATFNRQFKVK